MKNKLMLSVIASAVMMSGVASAATATNFNEALSNGSFSAKTRTFYMSRTFKDGGDANNLTSPKDSAEVLAFGGIMKYESAAYKNIRFGMGYYTSTKVTSTFTRKNADGTSALRRGGEDNGFLGEAYLEYNAGKTSIKLGRQQLATPLIQNHDLRMLPTVYEAAVVKNKSLAGTTVEVGLVSKTSGFTSKDSQFIHNHSSWGKNGLAYLAISNKSVKNLSIRFQYVRALSNVDNNDNEITVLDYKYLDAKYALPFGKKSFIKAQFGGNAFNQDGGGMATYASGADVIAKVANGVNKDSSTMIGLKAGTSFGMVDIAAAFNTITGNRFKAIESGPMYTDLQQGYGFYEESTGMGGQVMVHPTKDLSLRFAFVNIAAADERFKDDYSEFNFDGKYKINKASSLRLRFSNKDQTDTSGQEDRTDTRAFYYLNF